jgi:ABC-type multidrug transport system ATPase subunit
MNEHQTANMIETEGLTKRYGTRVAVSDVDLTVRRACAYGFLGHNGAGKTTLIRMLLGLRALTQERCGSTGDRCRSNAQRRCSAWGRSWRSRRFTSI